MKQKRKKMGRKLLSYLLTLAMVIGLMPGMGLTAKAWDGDPYADLLNTTTVVHFDGKEWYLIEDNSSALNAGTVTLLSKECVAASQYDSNGLSNTYEGSTVETAVNTYYNDSISSDVKSAVVDNKMFLLTTAQANAITDIDVRRCSKHPEAEFNVWWLCSPGNGADGDNATSVDGFDGEIPPQGSNVDFKFGVRPALKLDLSKVTFDSTSKTFTVGSATVDVTGVSLDKTTAQTIEVNGTVPFTATVEPDNATDKTVKWSVGGTDTGAVKLYSDEACTTEVGADATETLTVYAKGISAGSATITATSNADSEKKASCDVTVNAAQTQTEELLTTITATGKEQASYNPENVATVSFSNLPNYSSSYIANWGWWGYGWTATVTPADGYTITKCVFYDDANRTATDSSSPFEVKTMEEDKTPQVNGTPILAYTSKGITKIEVYGYATPAPALDPVSYMAWNGTTLVEKTGDDACTDYTVVTADTTTFEDGKWYVMSNSVTVSSRITVTGTVNLILCDGATLTASKGITVNSGNTINIYAQIGGTGELNAGSDTSVASIGGGYRGASSGTVNIHGGKITATGGSNASGIGGALEGGNGEVNIYSGEVTARGKNYAAGIGGYTGKSGGTVNIYGGIVNASGSQYGTTGIGIGGIKPGSCVVHIYGGEVTATSEKAAAGIQGTVTIDGGTVTAKGGVSDAIDCSSGETYSSNGINGTVTVNGGTVTATGGNVTANGYMGAIESYGGTIYACSGINGTVTISGGTVTATGGNVTGDIYNYRGGTIYACNGVNGTVTISGGTVTATGGSHTGNSSGTTVKEKGFGGSLTLGTGMYLYGGTSANPESNLSNYRAGAGDYTGDRYVYMTVNNVVPHIHSFTYTATGATITATCTAGCDITEGLALTISAPTELTYDGSAKAATLSTGYNTTAFPGEYMIKYYKGANEVEAANVKAAGDYTAKVTVGEATASVDFTIAKATPSIETIPTASAVTYGQKLADSTLTGGAAKLGDTTVAGTFAWKNTETKPAVSDSNATEYAVMFNPTDTDNYAAVECKVKLTVNRAEPTVTVPTAKTPTYNGSAQKLVNAGSATGGTMYYAVTTENTAPTDDNLYTTSIPTKTNAGTYYVWYKVAGDANHMDSTASNPIEVKIEKAANTVTVSLDGWTYGDTANTPTATATYGADEATFTYSTSADGTYGSVKPVDAGSYYVKATIAESTNYKSAVSAPVPFTIARKALTDAMVTLSAIEYEHDGNEKAPTITVKDGNTTLTADTDYAVDDKSSTTSSAAYGTYKIKVNGINNYTGSVEKEWKILDHTNPAAEIKIEENTFNTVLNTITFGLFFNKTETVTITAEDAGSGVSKIEYLTSTVSATTREAIDALTGTWTTVTNKTSASFSEDPEKKFIVYAKVTDVAGNVTYVTSEGVVLDTTAPVIKVDDALPVTEYNRAVSWAATDENLKDVVITFTAEGATTGAEVYDQATTGEQTGLYGQLSDIGSYTIKATDKAGNPKEVTFSIVRRDAIITGGADSITYEADTTYDLSQLFTMEDGVAVSTYEIVANADTSVEAGAGTITGSALTVTRAGLMTIKATVAEGQTSAATPEYIKETTATGTLTVSRAAGSAGISISDVVYGNPFMVVLDSTNAGVNPETKYTMTADATGNEIPAAGQTESTDKPVNAGTYKAVVSYPASALYNAVSAETTFKITPATLTVTAEAKEKTYGDVDPALTYSVEGLVYEDKAEDVLTGALTRAEGENAGNYAIAQGTLAANGNYSISYTGADLTIGQKTLTVTADAKSKTYGGEDPALTYSVSGLANGDTKETVLTGTLTRAEGEAVGPYAIGQGTLAANGNYSISYTGADLTIGQKTLTVTADAKSKTYGGEDPALTYSVSGLANGDTKETVLTGTLTRAEGEAVGPYAIGQGTLAANGNYTIRYTGADLTIGQKTLTVTADAKSKKYGEDDPVLTYTATGLENGDTKETVLTGSLTRVAGDTVGIYAIGQGSLAANDNYTIDFTGAELTIAKTESKVTAPKANTLTYTGKAQELITAGSTTDGTIVYSLDGKTYAEIIPTGANAGKYTVYYKVMGDGNHKDSEAVTVSVTIAKAEMADKTVADVIEVISAGVKDETMDLTEYLKDGAKLEKAEKSGELADYITTGELKDGIFTYSVAENDGGIAGSIVLTVSSTNYKDYNITINLVSAKKITEVVVESEDVKETAVEAVEVPALEDFTEAQPEATVEVKMEVKLESEETVEKELGTAVLEDIKETVAKAFDGVASTELSQEYLDITVTKSVNGGTAEEIADVNRVLEIAVGYDLTGKFNPVVIREHGGAVSQFTKLNSRPAAGSYKDGTFFVEGSGTSGKIYIYARYFSTYTVAYTTAASYQVTFDDATGDAKHDSNVTQVVVATGTKVAKPADPKRDGYDFDGWYVNGTNTKWNFDTAVTSDITLVAHWDEEDDDDDEVVATPAPVVTAAPRSPKTSDALPGYAFWLILAAAGLAVSTVSAKGRRKEQDAE